ncbi:VOC family protein [Roseateles amylovorans]|uniref:VOC family protein n=1 Tax=Roseateles amylovorans TaxID=2978473 RepID=A0ABY6B6X6_9BURK|nr:VOC family protein [Roseateles amylovorans]UXH78965.1 VOC family protein [Roseateles amylovorans]
MTDFTDATPRTGPTATQAVPPADGVIPYLTVRNAPAAITFYQQAFEARQGTRLEAPDGVMHAELHIGGARFMLTEERPQFGALSPQGLSGSPVSMVVFVPDVDATVARAQAAGATVDMAVQDQFWGDRMGQITDPFGHKWMVATHKEDLDDAQLKARMAAMLQQGKPSC